MNAQVKLDGLDQIAHDIELQNRRAAVFEIDRANAAAKKQPGWQPYDVLLDELQDVLPRLLPAMLSNWQAGDNTENGDILGRIFGGFAIRVQREREAAESKRQAEELWDEFIPSWRSQP